nr:DUF433 domain-containing protein [Jiella flava]
MTCDPNVLSGELVFTGTRVPVDTLFVYLASGDRLAEFLSDFPTVSKNQAVAAIQLAKERLIHHRVGRPVESAA